MVTGVYKSTHAYYICILAATRHAGATDKVCPIGPNRRSRARCWEVSEQKTKRNSAGALSVVGPMVLPLALRSLCSPSPPLSSPLYIHPHLRLHLPCMHTISHYVTSLRCGLRLSARWTRCIGAGPHPLMLIRIVQSLVGGPSIFPLRVSAAASVAVSASVSVSVVVTVSVFFGAGTSSLTDLADSDATDPRSLTDFTDRAASSLTLVACGCQPDAYQRL